jgi:hypothetical protein
MGLHPHWLETFAQGWRLADVVLIALSAGGILTFWKRTRFWIPLYIHFLAAVALAVGVWTSFSAPPESPVGKAGLLARILLSFALPAIVYGFFILRGGQGVAYRKRFATLVRCPNCSREVKVLRIDGNRRRPVKYLGNPICPNCGLDLTHLLLREIRPKGIATGGAR